MTTLHKAAQMALDALEWCEPAGTVGYGGVAIRSAAITALREALAAPPAAPAPAAPVVPDLKHCACEFDGDTCVTQCKLHAAHVDAIHEWAERAKAAEANMLAAPVVPLTDEQIRSMWKSSEFRGNGGQVDWFCEGIRAAEAHHGITGASK